MAAIAHFRLYVAGDAPHSRRAVLNLQSFCEAELRDNCRVEIIDLFEDPARALIDKVFLTPTLVVNLDGVSRQIVGNLNDRSALDDIVVGLRSGA